MTTFKALEQGCQYVIDEKNSKVKLRRNVLCECQRRHILHFPFRGQVRSQYTWEAESNYRSMREKLFSYQSLLLSVEWYQGFKLQNTWEGKYEESSRNVCVIRMLLVEWQATLNLSLKWVWSLCTVVWMRKWWRIIPGRNFSAICIRKRRVTEGENARQRPRWPRVGSDVSLSKNPLGWWMKCAHPF